MSGGIGVQTTGAAASEVRPIGVGMLGYAFMGKAHTNAYKKIPYMMYPPPAIPKLIAIAGRNEAAVKEAALRARLESEWVPELCAIAGLETHSLPVIWDTDFLYGPKTATGDDTFVLCEINASSAFAFPEFAMPAVARAAVERIRASS